MLCPNCKKDDLEDNDLFCSNCGVDVKSYFKVQKYNIDKIALVAQIQVSPTNDFTLSSDTMNEYQNLSKEIHDLQDIPQKLIQASSQLQFMQSKFEQDTKLHTNLKSQQLMYTKDITNLKKTTVNSIIARMKGEKEQRLKKEEEESLSLLNRIEGLEKRITDQQNSISSIIKHIADLKELETRLEQNKDALVKLISKTTKGSHDPIESKLERELQSLIKSYNPLQEQLNTKSKILNYLNSAYSDLNYAYQELQGASSNNSWDMFFGGGIILDSIKHSQMSKARDAVGKAHQSIEFVRNMDPNLPGIDAFVDNFNLFFNVMFDNIFTDWHVQNKINNSLNSVASSLNQLDNTIVRVQNDINRLQTDFSGLESHIAGIRNELLEQRRRMIEDAITRQHLK